MHQITKWLRDFAMTMTCEMGNMESAQVYDDLAMCFRHEAERLRKEDFDPFAEPVPAPEPPPRLTFAQAQAILDDARVMVPESTSNKDLFSASMQLLIACGLPQSLIGDYMEAHELGTISACDKAEMRRIFKRCLFMLERTMIAFEAVSLSPEADWPDWIIAFTKDGAAWNDRDGFNVLGDNAAWPL